MIPTQVLQEIRKIRFEEAYEVMSASRDELPASKILSQFAQRKD